MVSIKEFAEPIMSEVFEKLDVEERYSFGVYAGKMCEDCAKSGYAPVRAHDESL